MLYYSFNLQCEPGVPNWEIYKPLVVHKDNAAGMW